jgi:hypothetical protein
MRTNKLTADELQGHGLPSGLATLVESFVEADLSRDSGKADEVDPSWTDGPFTGRGSRARKKAAMDEAQALARKVIDEQPRMAFGHGFLWGVVAGVRGIIGAIDGRANHEEIERRVRLHPAVSSTWINLD